MPTRKLAEEKRIEEIREELKTRAKGREVSRAEAEVEAARRIGRPPILTEAIIEEVTMVLRRGSYLETAAAWIGVSYRTLARWRARGQAEIRRVEESGDSRVRIRSSEDLYVRFCHATERAIAESDVRDLTNIESAASGGQWQASAWRLERRHAHLWGRPWRSEDEAGQEEENPIRSLVDEMQKRREERQQSG